MYLHSTVDVILQVWFYCKFTMDYLIQDINEISQYQKSCLDRKILERAVDMVWYGSRKVSRKSNNILSTANLKSNQARLYRNRFYLTSISPYKHTESKSSPALTGFYRLTDAITSIATALEVDVRDNRCSGCDLRRPAQKAMIT